MPDRKHTFQYCLVIILPDTANFSRGCHIHTQHGIGFQKPGKGELWSLHSHVIQIEYRFIQGFHLLSQHDPGGHIDKVIFQYFRHEGKTPRRSQITLDDLDIIVLCQKLHIERTGYVQFFSDRAGNLFDSTDCLHVKFLCRENDGRITGMYAGKFNMFTDSISLHLALLCYGINFHLFRLFDKLGYHDRMIFRHLCRQLQEMQ